MTHLTPEQFIDVADGTQTESAYPHLAACAACRQQLGEIRATLTSVAAADAAVVPEPPPFFWNQFQQRVAAAVERDAASTLVGRLRSLPRTRLAVPALAAAAILVLAFAPALVHKFSVPPPDRSAAIIPAAPTRSSVAFSPGSSRLELLNDALEPDDASLDLVAELASSIDLADASDAGLMPHGTAEHAVVHLDPQELKELQRLLKAELGT